jgi:hypothetical protein
LVDQTGEMAGPEKRDYQTDAVGPNKQEVYSKAAPKQYKQDH